MRRSKRDMVKRAFERGYQMGLSGRSKDSCPHGKGPNQLSWLQGWREGRKEQWNGNNALTGSHQLTGY